MNQFDYNKPFRCRDGKSARLLGTFTSKTRCLMLAVAVDLGEGEQVISYWPNGVCCTGNANCDLENIPQQFEFKRWVNVYKDGGLGQMHLDQSNAEEGREVDRTCIACVEVTIKGEHGQGL